MDNQLMFGILLIIVGIAIGLIAVAVIINRREARISAALGLETEEVEDMEPPEPEDDEPSSEVEEDEPPIEVEEPSEEEGSESPPEHTPRERQFVAEIYREEVTGRLIILSGDREYADGKEIENETERRRLAYAASDLLDWFQGEFEFSARPAASPSELQTALPDQMLEEINGILLRSLAGTPDRGVRLISDATSGVKVLIGVKRYEIDDVPDMEIKDLIRQAVAEWEARQ